MTMYRSQVIDSQLLSLSTAGTSSGAIATFDTDRADNLVNLEVAITATGGGGTPTTPIAINGFDSSIIGVYGKNLFGGSLDGTLFPTKVLSGTQLTASMKSNSGSAYRINYYRADKTLIDYWGVSESTGYQRTFTTTEDIYYFSITNASGTVEEVQIEKGSSKTDYVPYTGTLYTINFGQTVYGGRLNVISGKLTITHGYISDLGALSWTKGLKSFYADITGAKIYDQSVIPNMLCEVYKPVSYNDLVSEQYNEVCSIDRNLSVILMRDTNYATASDFATAVTGKKAIYELATPTVIQLSSEEVQAIIGTNNVYADTGDILDLKFVLSVGKAIS